MYRRKTGEGGGVEVVEITCKGLDIDPVCTIHLTEIGVTSSLN